MATSGGVHVITDQQSRAIAPAEIAVVGAILSGSGHSEGTSLAVNINRAQVSVETGWILDIVNPGNDVGIDIPDGPFPVRAFVPDYVNYRGEVIIWITDGRLSGLEYAWLTDELPTRWPHPDELQIVDQHP